MIQLGRSLAMEWGVIKELIDVDDGTIGAGASGGDGIEASMKGKKRGIRVNVLCPGNIMTPVSSSSLPDLYLDQDFQYYITSTILGT